MNPFKFISDNLLKNSFICSSPPAWGLFLQLQTSLPLCVLSSALSFSWPVHMRKFSFILGCSWRIQSSRFLILFKFCICSVLLSLKIRLCLLVTCNILLNVTILRTDGDWRWFVLIIWVILILSSGTCVCTQHDVMSTNSAPSDGNLCKYIFLPYQSKLFSISSVLFYIPTNSA